jgi:hypothetical protein
MSEQVDRVKTFYSNGTHLGFSPWDIRIKLMEIIDKDNLTEHGIVIMSPAHAKALLAALQSTVQQYEDKYGEIDITKITEESERAQKQLERVNHSQ